VKIAIVWAQLCHGSNLDTEQMLARCPSAILEGKVVLRGYRLEFFGAADLEIDLRSIVPALAWRLSADDERALDRREGIELDPGPSSYVKVPTVATADAGGDIAGYIYVMTPHRRQRDPRRPMPDHVEHVLAGYRTFGFDLKILAEALARADA
jgi:hypothetical protein